MTVPRPSLSVFNWFRKSLQRKLVLWIMVFWLFSVTALSLTVFWAGQNVILDSVRRQNIQTASVAARDVNTQISSELTGIRGFTGYLESLDPNAAAQAVAIDAFKAASPDRYYGVYYFDEHDRLMLYLEAGGATTVLSFVGQTAETPMPDEVVRLAAVQHESGTGVTVSGVTYTELDRTPIITMAATVTFPAGDRVLVIQVELSDLWQHLLRNRVGESGFTYVVSKTGTIIAHPDPSAVGTAAPVEIAPVTQGYEGFVSYPAPGGAVYAAYSPVGGPTGWGIVVEQPVAEAQAPVGRAALIIGVVWLGLAVVGTGGVLWLTRGFTRPIVELTETTREIARTGRLVKTSLEERADEVGQLSLSFDRMVERLVSMEGRLATVAAEERNRLARDLHDAVSQTLFAASLIAEALPVLWERDADEGRRRLEEVRQLTRGALAEMRMLLLELRPSALVESDLPHLLTQLGDSIRGRTGIPVSVDIESECEYAPEVKIAAYRVAQEALNNVAKHAEASAVTVTAACAPDELRITITDDGRGFDPGGVQADSLGLRIMKERSEEVGATLTIDSRVGEGTTVSVVWKRPAREVER